MASTFKEEPMPASAIDHQATGRLTSRLAAVAKPLRRGVAKVPLLGAALRFAKRAASRRWRFPTIFKRRRLWPLSESARNLELQRQIDELRVKLRANRPLIADYQAACQRIVELEDHLLRESTAQTAFSRSASA
jgi:hypothetical protein